VRALINGFNTLGSITGVLEFHKYISFGTR